MSKKDDDPLLLWEKVSTWALIIAIIIWFLMAPCR